MVSQAMMSPVGHEIPLGRSTADQELRFEVFDIIHPYCLSPEDMEIVNGAELNTKVTSLLSLAKDQFRANFFPSNGAYPATDYAEMIGLPPGKSILQRLVLI